jgi:hypothetical protein
VAAIVQALEDWNLEYPSVGKEKKLELARARRQLQQER